MEKGAAPMSTQDTIEVVCLDMRCFKVDAHTLDPIGGSYYEPAAVTDPRGPQMSVGEWNRRRNAKRMEQMRAGLDTG
jgi:hypothetical protein